MPVWSLAGVAQRRVISQRLRSTPTAARAAYLAALLNLIAAFAMMLILRHGLPNGENTIGDRLTFIDSHLALWRSGWLLWNAAAITLLAFYCGLAGVFWRGAQLRCTLALVCATAGMAADISAESLYMGAGSLFSAGAYETIEQVASLLTGYVGNGLYTVAGILLVWAGLRRIPRTIVILSVPVWAAGFSLSWFSLIGSPTGQAWSTAFLMPVFILWTVVMGLWLQNHAS
jgi:hypothetical protein